VGAYATPMAYSGLAADGFEPDFLKTSAR